MGDYRFRRSYLTIIGGAVFFAACGAVIFTMDIEAGDGGRRAALLSQVPFAKEVLVGCCVLFVSICCIALFSGRPQLTASTEGLDFTGLFGKKFKIRWEDIQAIDVAKQYLTLHHLSGGKITKTNIGGMFKMKPAKMLDKFRELSSGYIGG
ncbi:MAG: PH domain-containing protein [Pseudomonadota bacterium]